MILEEGEPTRFLDVPRISKKTLHEQLKGFSDLRWSSSDSMNRVSENIIDNAKELLAGSNIDWELVLSSIRMEKLGIVRTGGAAIAAYGARFVGGLAGRAGWSMHDPQSVYLSGKYLGHIAGGKLEDFKMTMTLASVSYAEKTLPQAELLMKTLDFLLEHRGGRERASLVTKTYDSLGNGDIQGAYNIVSSFEDPVRRRGPALPAGMPDFSRTTTSSILIPPISGI